jgi:hypothetical protein
MHDMPMKMRFDARCPKCRLTVRFGTRAMRIYGGYFHLQCYQQYREYREGVKRGEAGRRVGL